MTDSFQTFQKNSLGVDTSKTNYLKTEVDLTKATNEQIDENNKLMEKHFDGLIKMHQDSIKARTQTWKELAQFTSTGIRFAKWARAKADANAALKLYYSPSSLDAVKHRQKNEDNQEVLEQELDDQQKTNYTAAGEIQHVDPELSHELKVANMPRVMKIQELTSGVENREVFRERAKNTVEVEVEPGVWKTWNEPGGLTARERRIVSAELDEIYITQFVNQGYSRGMLNKYLIKPMYLKHEQDLTAANAEDIKGKIAIETKIRNEQFNTKFKAAGTEEEPILSGKVIEDYIQNFAGYHSASSGDDSLGYHNAKQELQAFLLAGIEDETLDPNHVIAALQYKLSPNDGGPPRSIEEYLPKFAKAIKKAAVEARNANTQADEDEQESIINARAQEVLAEWIENKPSEDDVQQMVKVFKTDYGKVPDDIKNFASIQDIEDVDHVRVLDRLWRTSGIITKDDIKGLNDPALIATWKARITQGGLNSTLQSRKESFLTSHVSSRLWDQTLDKTKTNPQYEVIHSQAEDYFNQYFRAEKNLGQTDEIAFGLARDKTVEAIQKGVFDTRELTVRDETKAINAIKAKEALSKDNSIIYSSEPWAGEEEALKSALKYMTTGKGSIPQYYYQFDSINLTPHELMQKRLESTGMIKSSDVKPIPERKLSPTQQDLLLNKPSAARTNRALLDEYGVENIEELVELTGLDSVEQLMNVLRMNAERNNQTAGWEISQVNIDPALEEEHTQVVGEQSPFMRLNTMLPGVATAYVEDTYNV